jgi:hypothetical protein
MRAVLFAAISSRTACGMLGLAKVLLTHNDRIRAKVREWRFCFIVAPFVYLSDSDIFAVMRFYEISN